MSGHSPIDVGTTPTEIVLQALSPPKVEKTLSLWRCAATPTKLV
jgi:hypothetical protein